MKWKEVLDRSPPYLLSLAAAACFCAAVWLAWIDRVAAATLLSALFLVCVVLVYFPQLDSLKAFSVDIRLRRSLDRAEEILLKLRNISKVTARATYMSVAWSNRWGGMSLPEKQGLIDSVDAQLEEIGLDKDEIKSLARPYVELIGCDLYSVFYQSARSIFWRYSPNQPADIATRMMEWEAKWRPPGVEELRPILAETTSFNEYMKAQIPDDVVNEEEQDNLTILISRISNIYDDCKKRGGYTQEAIELLTEYTKRTSSGLPHAYYELLSEIRGSSN